MLLRMAGVLLASMLRLLEALLPTLSGGGASNRGESWPWVESAMVPVERRTSEAQAPNAVRPGRVWVSQGPVTYPKSDRLRKLVITVNCELCPFTPGVARSALDVRIPELWGRP